MDEKKLHHNNSYSKDASSKKDLSENKEKSQEKDTAAKRATEQDSSKKTASSCGCGCA